MTMGEIASVVALAFGSGAVPGVILFLLNRRGANKKLEIEEGGLGVNVFEAQTTAYENLLNRQTQATNDALTELGKYKAERTSILEKVEKLERADEDRSQELRSTNTKLETLRALFQQYVNRTGIPLTPEEQLIFEETKPITKPMRTNNRR